MAVSVPRLPNYSAPADPMAGIYSLLLQNPSMTEADTSAAEAAIAGGFGGSQFAVNNNARLRDSERIAREVQGQQLLQPYLERQQQSALESQRLAAQEQLAQQQNQFELGKLGQQTQAQRDLAELEQKGALERVGAETAGRTALEQIQQGGESARQKESIGAQQQNIQTQLAAESARQAVEQAGLDKRLTAAQQSELQRALLEGDQRMQQLILSEAGASARQRTDIAANLNSTMLQLQERRFESLLPLAVNQARGSGPSNDGRVAPPGTNYVATGGAADYRSTHPVPVNSGGNGNILSRVDSILRKYQLA